MEQKQIDFGQIKVVKIVRKNNICKVSKNNMERYTSLQVVFQQQDLPLWGEYNYLKKLRCKILE